MVKAITLDTLEKQLLEHDWTYEMSDDHRYWVSGTTDRKEIKVAVEKLYAMGLKRKVDILFYKHCPVEGCHDISGYGITKEWATHLADQLEQVS